MEMKKGSGRLIGGLIVLIIGVLFLLDSLDILDFDVVWDVFGWIVSIGMIVFGLGILIAQRFQRVFPAASVNNRRRVYSSRQSRL